MLLRPAHRVRDDLVRPVVRRLARLLG